MITDNEIQQLGWRPTGNGYTLAGWTLEPESDQRWKFQKAGLSESHFYIPDRNRLERAMEFLQIQKPLFTNPEEHLI